MRLRLRAIRHGCDFRKSEMTLFDEMRREKKYATVGALSGGECVLMVSCGGDQLVWVFASPDMDGDVTVTDSRKWRISGGQWNPDMLGHYAAAVGIELVGIRMFRESYADDKEERRKQRTMDEYVRESRVFIGG